MASTTSKVITYQEFLAIPETEGREEIVDGQIVEFAPSRWNHQEIIAELHAILVSQLDRKLVRVVASNFGLVIRKEPMVLRAPDLAIFVRKNIVEMDGYIHSAPELIVEVLSESHTRKDMVRKTEDYESIGVPEVWFVSPEGRIFEVLQLQDGKLRTTRIVNSGQLHSLRFPETAVDVASVWPD